MHNSSPSRWQRAQRKPCNRKRRNRFEPGSTLLLSSPTRFYRSPTSPPRESTRTTIRLAIASCLVDTNLLLRIARRSDPHHKLIDAALAKLSLAGTIILGDSRGDEAPLFHGAAYFFDSFRFLDGAARSRALSKQRQEILQSTMPLIERRSLAMLGMTKVCENAATAARQHRFTLSA